MTFPRVAFASPTANFRLLRSKGGTLKPENFGGGPPPRVPELPFGSGDSGKNGEIEPRPPLGNAVLGMMLFLGTDLMFFAALIGAFLVFRVGSVDWPPPGQPRLPLGVTGFNTFVLLFSGYTMLRAWHKIRNNDRRGLVFGLTLTAILGAFFLALQGFEWVRLVGYGVKLSSGVYGAIFYTLIGCHALHVLGAVIWLLIVQGLARKNRFSAGRHVSVQLCGMYWLLVVILWPVLYTLVYLS